jgi:IstB-like ATP binding protein
MRRAHPLADGHHLLLPQGVGLRRGLPSGVLSSLVGKGIGPTTRQPPIWPPAATAGRWATTMRFFAGPRLLVIDEVGYLPLQSEAAAALFQVIAQRYLKSSIVMTTNLEVSSWGQIFDDPMVAAAMLDRLLHRSVVFNIDGESYRMRSHRARIEKLRKGVAKDKE